MNSVVEFLRQTGQAIVRPEILGLPATTGHSATCIDRSSALLAAALASGDETQCRQIVLDLYLARHSACDIFDKVITTALHQIGDRWQHGAVEVYQERRACEICVRLLCELRTALPSPPISAPVAFGGTLSGDPYKLATSMVEVALREAGWRAESYGTELPVGTLCAAINDVKPRLIWLSVSMIALPLNFIAEYALLRRAAEANHTAVIVGGRALTDEVRRQMDYCAYCDTFKHVVSFAKTLYRAPAPKAFPEDPEVISP